MTSLNDVIWQREYSDNREDSVFLNRVRQIQRCLQSLVFLRQKYAEQKRYRQKKIWNLDGKRSNRLREFKKDLLDQRKTAELVEKLKKAGVKDAHVPPLEWESVDEAFISLVKEDFEEKQARLEKEFEGALVDALVKWQEDASKFARLSKFVPFLDNTHLAKPKERVTHPSKGFVSKLPEGKSIIKAVNERRLK